VWRDPRNPVGRDRRARRSKLSKILWASLRITVAVTAVLALLWWFGVRMPGKNISKAGPLSPEEVALREELRADVQKLAGEIGERNMWHYTQLNAAADFIEDSFSRAGLHPRRDSYEIRGQACHNIEAEIPGRPQGTTASQPSHLPIIVIGAHYDSVFGSPGANDNGSGVAALLALARRFASRDAERRLTQTPYKTLRFVAFVNEEPPYFLSDEMGSFIYASRCKTRGDKISAMISLETIGYFSDAPHSQTYPSPGLGIFYPRVGNFIGFVSNVQSRALLRRVVALFRKYAKTPSEGAALPSFIPGVSWSDQWSFWRHGYPGIMVTDTAPFRYPHYHSSSDTPDKLDYDRFTLVVSGMQKAIEDMDKL
jgi:peptidase M28-like protein